MTWNDLKLRPLTVYSTTWCPDCHRLKKILDEHGISYRDVDIDKDEDAARRLREKTSRTAIPYVQIDGGEMVRGWHDGAPGRFDEHVFLKEMDDAVS